MAKLLPGSDTGSFLEAGVTEFERHFENVQGFIRKCASFQTTGSLFIFTLISLSSSLSPRLDNTIFIS